MEQLNIQFNKAYITKNGETAFIAWSDNDRLYGFVSGLDAEFCEWLNSAVNLRDSNLNLVKETKIEIKNFKKFENWRKKLTPMISDEHDKGILWVCTIQWARLMEEKIKAGQKIDHYMLAQEAGLTDHPDGEFAITILYQCWKYGDIFMNVEKYRPYCTLE